MKYEEMKERTQMIDRLRNELNDIEFVIKSKGFLNATLLTNNDGQISVGKDALNKIMPLDTLRVLATIRKSKIHKKKLRIGEMNPIQLHYLRQVEKYIPRMWSEIFFSFIENVHAPNKIHLRIW
jgi:hypothetical protein